MGPYLSPLFGFLDSERFHYTRIGGSLQSILFYVCAAQPFRRTCLLLDSWRQQGSIDSLNDTDENHLREALDVLKKQKDDKIVYAYYVDETADAMIGEEASIALCYSGEAALAMAENDNLDYSVPKEGSNLWIDSWFIPKSCTNQTNALKFLNFLCKDDIAEKNFEYVQYAAPITSVVENQDADVKNNEAVNPYSDTFFFGWRSTRPS
mgnify:CR=1 FL=1